MQPAGNLARLVDQRFFMQHKCLSCRPMKVN
jgi:hypothetical protein